MEMTDLRCLSLDQPWASLVAIGVKTIETRSWPTKHRGRIGIASTAKRPGSLAVWIGGFDMIELTDGTWRLRDAERVRQEPVPFGAIVATANLVDCVRIVNDRTARNCVDTRPARPSASLRLDDLVGLEVITDISGQLPYGDFTPGRWAWLLDDVKPTTERCPECEGAGRVADRRPEARRSFGCPMEWRSCPTCDGNGGCDPIPVKGKQRLWWWKP